jgi:Effector-associated domain 5
MAGGMGHLAHDEITALHAAAVAARLAERRLAVLAGVDPGVVALLATAPVPVDQLLQDLHGLNAIAVAGGADPPLALWLKNALTLVQAEDKAAIAAAAGKAVDAFGLRPFVDTPPPARRREPHREEKSRPDDMGDRLASCARVERTSFEWEEWLHDRCAKGDHASLALLAADLQDADLGARVREMAHHVEAGKWPPGMAPTLLRLERTSAGWHADVRIGFLGQVCSVALRPGARVPLGVGASLEAEEQDGEVLVRLVARAESALRGTRARIRAGARVFTKWLVPPGTGALGSDPEEMTLFELALPDGPPGEEEGS